MTLEILIFLISNIILIISVIFMHYLTKKYKEYFYNLCSDLLISTFDRNPGLIPAEGSYFFNKKIGRIMIFHDGEWTTFIRTKPLNFI